MSHNWLGMKELWETAGLILTLFTCFVSFLLVLSSFSVFYPQTLRICLTTTTSSDDSIWTPVHKKMKLGLFWLQALSYLYSPRPPTCHSPPYWNKVFLFLQKKRAVSVNQVSVNSENPSHSSFRENYEYGFAVVVFESAAGWIVGLWAPRNTC